MDIRELANRKPAFISDEMWARMQADKKAVQEKMKEMFKNRKGTNQETNH